MALYTEVAKLQLPYLNQAVADTIVTSDQFLAMLPIFDAKQIQYQYTQESNLGSAGNSGSLILPDGTFTPNSASYTSVQHRT